MKCPVCGGKELSHITAIAGRSYLCKNCLIKFNVNDKEIWVCKRDSGWKEFIPPVKVVFT